ncbi:MAG: hypothetical protein D9V47_01465 [Clostridia bacterium]|nr:MAG: hypothetical protein D9V47_01465 [Clostridia bacterium]
MPKHHLSKFLDKVTGKEVLEKVDEYSETYGEVLLGLHREFEKLQGMVEGYRRELEVATGEMRRLMGGVKTIQAYLDDKAQDVAKAAEEVAGSLETAREIEGRLLSLTDEFRQCADELKMLPGRTAVCARAAVLSVLALAIAIGVAVWTLV